MKAPPHFDQALAAGLFEGALREAIHCFKYRPIRALGTPLGDWMVKQVHLVSDLDLLLPVPLHRRRLKVRGFNQALLLGAIVGERFRIPVRYDVLSRVRDTRPQVVLAADERARNVQEAFSVTHPPVVKDRRILLVDDVFTTGATLNECSRVLKAAGALSVTAFTLARAAD